MVASDWIGIAGIIAAPVLGFIAWLVTISNRVGKLETKVDIFWQAVSIDAAKILHSPHPGRERLDQLIDVYVEGKSTKEDLIEMRECLEVVMNDKNTPCGERSLASILMRAIEFLFDWRRK